MSTVKEGQKKVALGAKSKRATPDEYGLFGYGQRFEDFPLFYADGELRSQAKTTHFKIHRVCVLRASRTK
jgi:hypothetical protein